MLELPINVAEALKADTRYIVPQVEIYFDGIDKPPVVLDRTSIVSFNSLSEVSSSGEFIVGKVCSGTFDLELLNTDGRFTITNKTGPYYGKLVEGVRIDFKILVDTDVSADVSNFYTMPMGTYYATEWKSSTDSLTCTVPCYDVLYTVLNQTMPCIQMMQHVTGYDLFDKVLSTSSIPIKYNIDKTLSMPVTYGFIPGEKYGDALVELCVGCGATVFVDRFGVVQVRNAFAQQRTRFTCNDTDYTSNIKAIPSTTKKYDKVVVSLNTPSVLRNQDILLYNDIEVNIGYTYLRDVLFSKTPLVRLSKIDILEAKNTYLREFKTGTYKGSFMLDNAVSKERIKMKIRGDVLDSNISYCVAGDEQGTSVCSIESPVIQDKDFAISYGKMLYDFGKSDIPQFELDLRGLPQLDIGDVFTLSSSKTNIHATVTPIQIEHTMTETLSTRVTCVPYTNVLQQNIVFISPGLSIEIKEEM